LGERVSIYASRGGCDPSARIYEQIFTGSCGQTPTIYNNTHDSQKRETKENPYFAQKCYAGQEKQKIDKNITSSRID
jgi:hypothetical protein